MVALINQEQPARPGPAVMPNRNQAWSARFGLKIANTMGLNAWPLAPAINISQLDLPRS